MGRCRIDADACQTYTRLLARWRKDYPRVDGDLKDAFAAISENIGAKKGRRMMVSLPNGLEAYKYRQNSKDIRRGESYGWRIIAIFDRSTGTMYPVLVYPKPEWADADTSTLKDAILDLKRNLGYCVSTGCDGKMAMAAGTSTYSGTSSLRGGFENRPEPVRYQCGKCGAVGFRDATVE